MKYLISTGKKKQVSFYADDELLKKFQERYPRCLTLFLNRALSACLADNDIFEKIFFNFRDWSDSYK